MALHFPVGLANGLLSLANPSLAIIFGAGFLAYEISENFDEHDKAYPDIAGWLWGLFFTGALIGIWKCLT